MWGWRINVLATCLVYMLVSRVYATGGAVVRVTRLSWLARGLGGRPLLVKLIGVVMFGGMVRVVHTWRLRRAGRRVELAAAVCSPGSAAAVR